MNAIIPVHTDVGELDRIIGVLSAIGLVVLLLGLTAPTWGELIACALWISYKWLVAGAVLTSLLVVGLRAVMA